MRRLHSAAMLALVMTGLAGPAQAQIRRLVFTKIAESGHRSLLGSTTNLDINCNFIGISPARVLLPPEHGQLFVGRGVDYPNYNPANDRYRCRFRRYPAERIFYQSVPGYVGTDRFEIENVSEDGGANVTLMNVVVQ